MPQDVVMAPGLDAFKRGLDRFLEEKSIGSYKPGLAYIIFRIRRNISQNVRCRGGVSIDRYLVGIWWGHCEIKEAGLDGPLA